MERPRCSLSSQASPPPTTIFIQADPETFRDLVQKHTAATVAPSSARPAVGPRRPAFKLQERRPSARKLEVKLGLTSFHHHSPRTPQPPAAPGLHHPSPVTPLGADALFSPRGVAEERAIAQRGFYLPPSPRAAGQPKLLPLFPLTSPKL